MNHEMEMAEAIGALFIDQMSETLASRISHVILEVVNKTLEGTVAGWKASHPSDHAGHSMYVTAINELANLVRQAAVEKTRAASRV